MRAKEAAVSRRPCLVLVAALLLLAGVPPAAQAGDPDVAALQVALRARGLYGGTIDGLGGPGTAAGVRVLQARHRLAVDGIAGPRTRRVLGRRGRPRLGSRALVEGRRGWDVAGVQFLLGARGFPSGTVDGGFGPQTGAALRRFQSWAGLGADGVAGPATLAALRRPAPRSVLGFRGPVAAPLGDRFGPRANRFHSGVDYVAPHDQAVWAAGRGCVAFAGWDAGGYGLSVVIAHRAGMTSHYAHLSSLAVRAGECLVAGRRIGNVGSTGRSSGPHLHFELRLRGAVVDPLSGL